MGERRSCAQILGEAAANTRYGEVPTAVRERAVDILLDTIAAIAVGSDSPTHQRLQHLLGSSSGGSTVIGQSAPTGASVAAFLNGTAPTVYQLDEGHRLARGHPAIHIVPAVLALAEADQCAADALLSALIAGYEVGVRLGQSMGGTRPDIHPHGNWGTVAAAAAAAHILSNADAAVIATAIDMAAGLSLHTDRTATTRGNGTHHLMPATGASIAVLTACAAVSGFDSTPGCLENFFAPRAGAHFDPELLLAGISEGTWSEHAMLGSYIKFWPACGFTHTSIGAILRLHDQVGFTIDDIVHIEVKAFRAAAALRRNDDDVNDLAARYSIPCVVAAALRDGKYWLDSLNHLDDPEFRELTRLVTVVHDPDLDSLYPAAGRPAAVTVELADGRTVSTTLTVSLGDVELPASREQIHAKAATALAHRFSPEAAARICESTTALGQGAPIQELSAALRAAAHER
jgi:2-methylcitrate dehydratase PrpD